MAEGKIERFNEALVALLAYFSDRKFDRVTPISLEEASEDSAFWIRSPRKKPGKEGPAGVNITYCPPGTYGNNSKHLVHVRVYDPNEAESVKKLLTSIGLEVKVFDNDPYSKVDINAVL